jgi:hypothetical protein
MCLCPQFLEERKFEDVSLSHYNERDCIVMYVKEKEKRIKTLL